AENLAESACFYRRHSIGEISRKGAKPLRSGNETRLFDSNAFFAPSRLSVKNSSLPCVTKVSRKGAKPLRFRTEIRCFDSYAFFAPSRLGVKNFSLPCVAKCSRKAAKALRIEIEAVLLNWVNLRSFCFLLSCLAA